ncbi:hypothetical protein IWW57_000425 [Coemansia sp. S610]|nr:hypothetical protein IWW57_000425 [Coemansia sp. S610]
MIPHILRLPRIFRPLSSSRFMSNDPQNMQPVKFLFPNHNPHGQWTGTTPPHRLWTLAERRALFIYTRALQVHRNTEPNWELLGERLNRDARECKFTASYMTRSWMRYKNITTKKEASLINAGITADQLLSRDFGTDTETASWLRKLCDPPEPALTEVKERKTKRRSDAFRNWTREELLLLMDLCPLLRASRAQDMEPLLMDGKRTMAAITVKKGQFAPKVDLERTPPLTEKELDVVRAAVDRKSADDVTWKDVKDQLPDRTFAQTLRLLERHRIELYRYEKSRRIGLK